MEIVKIKITKKDLDGLQENERLFFLHMLNIFNDINCLQKLAAFSINTTIENNDSKDILDQAQNSQSVFILLVLAGKLYEAWRVLEKDYFKKKLSKTYDLKLSDKGKENLEKLKRNFNNSSLIKEIRRKFAFHYDTGKIEEQYKSYAVDQVFELYLSNVYGNCLFSPNSIVLHKILKLVDPRFDINADFKNDKVAIGILQSALRDLIDVINETAKAFRDFIGECLILIVNEHEWAAEAIEIPEPQSIKDIKIPFFIKP